MVPTSLREFVAWWFYATTVYFVGQFDYFGSVGGGKEGKSLVFLFFRGGKTNPEKSAVQFLRLDSFAGRGERKGVLKIVVRKACVNARKCLGVVIFFAPLADFCPPAGQGV